ncbi:MAG: Stk1 family PASTA domain-containing Ser/Thr kinase [Tessaracoccus sp.]
MPPSRPVPARAQSATGLNHPNIVAVYDTGEGLDSKSDVMVPFIVMELVEGITLREVLRDGRFGSCPTARSGSPQVLDALSYSHRAGIIHRDIKPANVMLTPQGSIKVMDFGIARAVADTSATMTQTAAVIGTAQYLSPEQARGEKVDSRSDIYSVGCLLYELLVGEPPFKGDSPVSVAYQHVREEPVPPSQRDSEVTPEMDAIVLKALAKDPRDRYQDATEFREDISAALNGQTVMALSQSSPAEAATQVIGSDPLTTTVRRPTVPTAVVPAESQDQDEDIAEEERPKRTGLKATLIVLTVLLVGALAGAVYMIMNPSGPTTTTVPSVVGYTEAAAVAAIEDADLVPEVQQRADAEVQEGDVIETDPPAETSVEVGSPVTLYISIGPGEVEIPTGLAGLSYEDAAQRLRDADLEPVRADEASNDVQDGRVIRSDPEEGATAKPGDEVTLVVSSGPDNVQVPEGLAGLSFNEAAAALREVGLVAELMEEPSDSVPEGEVIRTEPGEGQTASPGSTVSVVVSRGSDLKTVPSLIGLTEQQAEEALQRAGITSQLEVFDILTENETIGVIFAQQPNADQRVPADTTIQVNVAVSATSPDPDPTESETPDASESPSEAESEATGE